MRHLPDDWEATSLIRNECPAFLHTGCEGLIVLSRPQPDKAGDLAQCDACGKRWTRTNARYLWKPQNPGKVKP